LWAASKGVRVPDYCVVIAYPECEEILHRGKVVPAKYVSFSSVRPNDTVYWHNPNVPDRSVVNPEFGKVVVNIDPRIMQNDEEFLHVLAHEVREIELVEQHLAETGEAGVSGETFFFLVEPSASLKNNAHWSAWEFADTLVEDDRKKYDSEH
jgi:hypothetical protein